MLTWRLWRLQLTGVNEELMQGLLTDGDLRMTIVILKFKI